MRTNTGQQFDGSELLAKRSLELFEDHYRGITVRTDRLFAWLMVLQWAFGILLAVTISPTTWRGATSSPHVHVYAAVVLGGLLAAGPVYLAWRLPGRRITRNVIACTQMLWSALLIHLTGGRIETHFHVFGSLAILAFYRDWTVLVPATVVVAVDHLARGIWWPESVYGVLAATPWRSLEHAAWVGFENVFLVQSCRQGIREMWDIARRRAELERTGAIAAAASRAKSTFLANMSHEIRTPLNGILGFTDLLQKGAEEDTAERMEWLSTIQTSSRHLLALINDILDISKIEADHLELEHVPFSPGDVIAETASILRPRAEERGLQFEVTFESKIPQLVYGDPTRFRQVLMNLAGNAIKFTERGSVRVATRYLGEPDSGELVIEIVDTGIGIPADKVGFVFEPFVQADASVTRKFGGTGLGLAISRRIARALGGDIIVRSVANSGSVFTFVIPVQSVGDNMVTLVGEATETRRSSQVDSASPQLRGRLLLVEDGDINRKMLKLVLTRAGLEVSTAENGQVAVEMTHRESFDIILLDMQMPVMDGYAAARIMREQGITTEIIALTANAMRGDEDLCRAAGCSGYLTKPVDPVYLKSYLASRLLSARSVEFKPENRSVPELLTPIRSTLPTSDPEFRALVEEFVDSLPGRLEAALGALRAADAAALARLAHGIKGAGGTVGLHEFTSPAAALEESAKEQSWDEAEAGIRNLQQLAARVVIDPVDSGVDSPGVMP